MITRVIGIDFGTSTTVVRILNYEETKIGSLLNLNFDGHPDVPTVIFKQKGSDEMSFGYEAEAQLKAHCQGDFISNFKIDLTSSDEVVKATAESYVKAFIGYLYKIYSQCDAVGDFGHCDKTDINISYPSKWLSNIRCVMKNCVIEAGFGKLGLVKGLDESEAAILDCIHENERKLIDNGLFSASVKYKGIMIKTKNDNTDILLFNYEITNKNIILSNLVTYPTAGDDNLCGDREIDKILYDYLVFYTSKILKSGKIPPGVLRQFTDSFESWKERIVFPSLKKNKSVNEPSLITSLKEDLEVFGIPMNEVNPFCIDRILFELLTSNYWKNWRNLIAGVFHDEAVLNKGYTNPDDINLLILGGNNEWYCVKDFFLGKSIAGLPPLEFGQIQKNPERIIQPLNPQEAIAAGLCYNKLINKYKTIIL